MLPQKLDAGDDAVLAERKSFNAVIARRAERFAAAVTIDYRRILNVISAIH